MATWRDRIADARKFLDVAQTVNAPGYTNQAASNAVLAVIAANDAVCLFFTRKAPAGDSHTEAAKALQRACQGQPCEGEASEKSRQLLDMLRQKSTVQYHGRPISADAADKILKRADRFVEWAGSVLPPTT